MNELIAPLLREPAKHLLRFMRESKYREYCFLSLRHSSQLRYVPCVIKMRDYQLRIPDAASFLSGYKEIFVEDIYLFKTAVAKPRIIDLGANIGLSVIYFKNLYPESNICALEADPKIFDYLKQNIQGNGFKDVTLINKAAWDKNTTLKFMSEGADGGRLGAVGGNTEYIDVEAIDVSGLISEQRVDLLKIDIEGAEVNVLVRCQEALGNVQRVFVEYHSKLDENQHLSTLLDVLESQGFRYHIHSMLESQKPFLGRKTMAGYDMLLNIFAWREGV